MPAADDPKNRFFALLDRYRPAAIAGVAVLIVIAVLPGASGDGRDGVDDIGLSAATGIPRDDARERSEAPEEPRDAADPVDLYPQGGASISGTSRSRDSSSSGASGDTTPRSSAPSTTFGGTGGDLDDSDPLHIAAAGWATEGAGTPAANIGVPDGSLPVGKRLSRIDKATFVRLAGDETTLRLTEHPEGNRGSGGVQACRIKDPGWEAKEGMSWSEAPAWDVESCVVGQRSEDGTWTFSLVSLGSPTDVRGFALVPAPDAPIDFQVAFQPAA